MQTLASDGQTQEGVLEDTAELADQRDGWDEMDSALLGLELPKAEDGLPDADQEPAALEKDQNFPRNDANAPQSAQVEDEGIDKAVQGPLGEPVDLLAEV